MLMTLLYFSGSLEGSRHGEKDGRTALQEMPYLPPSLAMALNLNPLTPALGEAA